MHDEHKRASVKRQVLKSRRRALQQRLHIRRKARLIGERCKIGRTQIAFEHGIQHPVIRADFAVFVLPDRQNGGRVFRFIGAAGRAFMRRQIVERAG